MATPYARVLDETRELATQVREAAERVHQQALEAHRLTEIARQQSEKGRRLSKIGREEARAVANSMSWSIAPAHRTERHVPGKPEV